MDAAETKIASGEQLFNLILAEWTEYVAEAGASITEIVEEECAAGL
jgi:hypothetical protein